MPAKQITRTLEDDEGRHLATLTPAKEADAARVLRAAVDDDGRSEWTWFRLANGDLVLGVFPRGDTYESLHNLDL